MRLKIDVDQLMKVIVRLGQKSPPSCANNLQDKISDAKMLRQIYNLSYRVDTTKSRDAVEYRSIFRQRNF